MRIWSEKHGSNLQVTVNRTYIQVYTKLGLHGIVADCLRHHSLGHFQVFERLNQEEAYVMDSTFSSLRFVHEIYSLQHFSNLSNL
jgi:hypothetical protein